MSASESWRSTYRELIETIVHMGYPEEFGKAIAKNLGSEKTMRRMTAYLYSAKPRSAEEIADEMLAIMSDRERLPSMQGKGPVDLFIAGSGKRKPRKQMPYITSCCMKGWIKMERYLQK